MTRHLTARMDRLEAAVAALEASLAGDQADDLESLTRAELEERAAAAGVDLTGARTKSDVRERLEAAL